MNVDNNFQPARKGADDSIAVYVDAAKFAQILETSSLGTCQARAARRLGIALFSEHRLGNPTQTEDTPLTPPSAPALERFIGAQFEAIGQFDQAELWRLSATQRDGRPVSNGIPSQGAPNSDPQIALLDAQSAPQRKELHLTIEQGWWTRWRTTLARGLSRIRIFASALDHDSALVRARIRARDRDLNRDVASALDVAHTLVSVLDADLAHDLDLARELAKDLVCILASTRDCNHAPDSAISIARDLASALDPITSNSVPDCDHPLNSTANCDQDLSWYLARAITSCQARPMYGEYSEARRTLVTI